MTAEFLSTLSLRRATFRLFFIIFDLFRFLSTLSLRRATTLVQIIKSGYARISIHALLAESDNTADKEARKRLISIHALLAESDPKNPVISVNEVPFLSTLSLRRATSVCSS